VREPLEMEREASLFEDLARTREFKKGWITRMSSRSGPDAASLSVLVSAAQRNISLNKQRKTLTHVRVPITTGTASGTASSAEAPAAFGLHLPQDCAMLQVSPSGDRVLFARVLAGAEAEKTSVIWELCTREGHLLKEFHVPGSCHGAVYPEGYISRGITWSPDEKTVAYVAEVPAKHKTPIWGTDLVCNSDLANDEEKGTKATAGSWTGLGAHEEDWGELFVNKKKAAVYLLDLEDGKVAQVRPQLMKGDTTEESDPYGEMDAVTCGKPSFSADGKMILFTCWPHIQRDWVDEEGNIVAAKKLGLVYCYSRACYLQVAKCEAVWKAREDKESGPVAYYLLTGHSSSHSAVFHPETRKTTAEGVEGVEIYKVLFLSHESAYNTGAHNTCAELCSVEFACDDKGFNVNYHEKGKCEKVISYDSKVVVPTVGTPKKETLDSKAAFQGLYCSEICENAIHKDTLYLSSIHRCAIVVLAINLGTGKVKIITDAEKCHTIIGAGEGRLLVSTSSPGEIPSVLLYDVAKGEFSPVLAPKQDEATKTEVSVKIQQHYDNFDSILLTPTHSGALDTVLLMPHGGPHSAHTCGWVLYYEFLLQLGYTLLLVNYRGSIGFGNDSLLSLPGNVGTNDVSDCMQALDHTLSENENLKKVGVMGGSHGGFLTLHLLGQHSDRFDVGIARNPVTSIAGMVSATDIPEWCYCEALGVGARPRCFGPTAEDLDKMLRASPIYHAKNVKAPTLWLLGKEDKRVRPLAAMDYIA